jgi:hypothetical protein
MERMHFLIIQTPEDYWALRGSTDWKSDKAQVMDFKKFLVPTDSNGKYPWEFGYLEDEEIIRKRDWFVDIEKLLSDKWITQADHDGIRDFSREYGSISINRPIEDYLVHEDVKARINPTIHNMAVAVGTFSIGAGLDYATVTAFEADIAVTMTGNLTGEHADEETAISTGITFDTDAAGFLLKLTAASGAEHNGGVYGNGARINYAGFDNISFDETTDGDLDNVEVSKLALDISGNSNSGIRFLDGGNSGELLADRLLIKGDSICDWGINTGGLNAQNVVIRNNIMYGITDASNGAAIRIQRNDGNFTVYNNTCIKNRNNIYNDSSSLGSTTLIVKNNLTQGGTNADWFEAGAAGFGTTAKNISEDVTSPDASYRSKDLHTNTIFFDYANDDYKLDPAGDATNLAIADDGENLFGVGVTEDIAGQARDNGTPFWIGASHIAAAVGGIVTPYYYTNLLAGGR